MAVPRDAPSQVATGGTEAIAAAKEPGYTVIDTMSDCGARTHGIMVSTHDDLAAITTRCSMTT